MVLKQKKQNCFSVPAGHSEQFVTETLQHIPQQPVKRRIKFALPVRVAVAACLVGVVMGLSSYVYFHNKQIDLSKQVQASGMNMENNAQYSYQDAVMDYAMMDNTDIYACITSTEY